MWERDSSTKPTGLEYLATRDPVSGAVYYAMLAVFAIMPLHVARR